MRKSALGTNGLIQQIKTYKMPTIKLKVKHRKMKKFPVTVVLRDSMVKDIKDWKISSRIRKVVKKHYNHHTSFQQLNKKTPVNVVLNA